jgi:hypothetical protein
MTSLGRGVLLEMELDDRINRNEDEVIVDRNSFRQLRWWREGKKRGKKLDLWDRGTR